MTYRSVFRVRYTLFKNAICIFCVASLRLPSLILVAIAIYFVLFAAIAGLVVFAPARQAVARSAGRLAFGMASSSRLGVARVILDPSRCLLRLLQRGGAWCVHNRRMIGIAGCVVLTPSVLVVWLQGKPVFDFVEQAHAPDPKIARLLVGERLSPPPSLAPEMFTTREVELVRPATAWGSRNWALLDDDFRQRLLSVFKLMEESHGYQMVILEGFRSAERQAALAAMGPSVTLAAPGMSYHQHGLAADCAFVREGELVISEKDPWAMRGYQLYGALAEQAGLTWGGQWRMRDYGHVELRLPGVLSPVAPRD